MFKHRFREQLATLTQDPPEAAFVACTLTQFSPAHAAFVAEVYRVAREHADARLRKPARSRLPAFSLN